MQVLGYAIASKKKKEEERGGHENSDLSLCQKWGTHMQLQINPRHSVLTEQKRKREKGKAAKFKTLIHFFVSTSDVATCLHLIYKKPKFGKKNRIKEKREEKKAG